MVRTGAVGRRLVVFFEDVGLIRHLVIISFKYIL